MTDSWHGALKQRLSEASEIPEPSNQEDFGIWKSLQQSLTIALFRPQVNPDVIAIQLKDRHGDYFVLKNTVFKTYQRLSASEHHLWLLMDGSRTVQELIVEHFLVDGVFAHQQIIQLVNRLVQNEMLTERPLQVWSSVQKHLDQRSWLGRLSKPADFFLTRRLSIGNLDRLMSGLYRYLGWLFFTRPANFLFVLISATGLVAYWQILSNPNFRFIQDNLFISLATLWLSAVPPVIIHELGHALTVKHYRREVGRGGLMLYFGMPAAFMETTDIWLEPRRARLATTWNGPYTGLILGGCAAILIYLIPGIPFSQGLFTMAGIAYLLVFININPFLKLDGYFLLSDLLDIPGLRERSLAFLRRQLPHKLIRHEKFQRMEIIFLIFGLLSLGWTIYAIYLAFYFWQVRLGSAITNLLGEGVPLPVRLLSLLLLAALASFLILVLLQIVRLLRYLATRFIQSGVLSRHGKIALFAAIASILLALVLPARYSPISTIVETIGIGLVILASLRLFFFSQIFGLSRSGWGWQIISLAIFVLGVTHLFRLFISTEGAWMLQISTSGLFIIGFLIVGNLSTHHKNLPGVFLGLLLGGSWLLGTGQFLRVAWQDITAWLPALALCCGTWSGWSLRGSARSPAILLVLSGIALYSLSWLYFPPIGSLSIAGLLLCTFAGLHLVYARLPQLTIPQFERAVDPRNVIGSSVALIVRRVLAQVFFEAGYSGAGSFAMAFNQEMRQSGLNISMTGNQFHDEELPNRSADQLSEVYLVVLEKLQELATNQLGGKLGKLVFAYGVDLLPWQDREVMAELILCRLSWIGQLIQQDQARMAGWQALLKRVPVFSGCDETRIERIAKALKAEQIASGEMVFRQGEPGDKFYIIERGVVTVWKTGEDGIEMQVNKLGRGQYFGEIALVAMCPRTASVRAETPLRLLTLEVTDFESLVKEHVDFSSQLDTRLMHGWLLRSMPIFDELDHTDLEQLAERLQPVSYQAGQIVLKQGEPGDKFYIVERGKLHVIREEAGEVSLISECLPGEYFGEVALLYDCNRTATLIAAEDTTLLILDRANFDALILRFDRFSNTLEHVSSRRMAVGEWFTRGKVESIPKVEA